MVKERSFFVWDDEPQPLGLPYFYLGKRLIINIYTYLTYSYKNYLICSIFHPWHWNWIINNCVYLGTFVQELFKIKRSRDVL